MRRSWVNAAATSRPTSPISRRSSAPSALATAPVEQVERTLAVNLLGVWRTNRAVIGQITARRGYLLNISSLSAVTHGPMMGPYTAAKAGVEALTDALRMETAPSGARVGCAYFGFLDTDLVKAAFAQPSAEAMTGSLPGFIRNPAPLYKAIDAIELGVERRSARVWAPRWLGPMLVARGIMQPLTEWNTLRNSDKLAEAIRLASSSGESQDQDALLGVAAQALTDGPVPQEGAGAASTPPARTPRSRPTASPAPEARSPRPPDRSERASPTT
jgi:NAD(P)-dependent dehydrogenase (short-subunit alcohol dehydrogenase family)